MFLAEKDGGNHGVAMSSRLRDINNPHPAPHDRVFIVFLCVMDIYFR
jgi:hypothetical protein